MNSAVNSTANQLTVVDVDWSRFKALFELRGPQPLLSQIQSVTTGFRTESSGRLLKALQQVPPAQRESHLISLLQSEVARIMGLPPGQKPSLYQGFFEMGLDSLMAVELKTALEESLTCELPGTLVFEVPTIHDLSNYLIEHVLDGLSEESACEESVSTAIDRRDTTVVQMSESEVDASIAEKLARLESLIGG